MASYRDFVNAFREVGLNASQPVIVHASLSQIGEIRGGPETAAGALVSVSKGVMAPTFTFKTMLIPEDGPAENGLTYGTGKTTNRMAEFFLPDMPADGLMGVLPETLRKMANAKRSCHPILSFSGVNVDSALNAQTIEDPLAPIGVLAEENGLVLLIGVDHTVNTSFHYAEKLAGRKQFIRWALTPQGVKECPGFPGCSDGFEQAVPYLADITRTAKIGNATLRMLPLAQMVTIITEVIKKQPLAFLCHKMDCQRCETVRRCVSLQP